MVFQLIQLPISVIFIAVFAFAVLLVLYKLRKKGKIYRLLFSLSLAAFVLVLLFLLGLVLALLF
jgi:hypothetical protein